MKPIPVHQFPGNMNFGDRIQAPRGVFQDEFPEMRYFGPYQSALLPATVFRLLELAYEEPFGEPGAAPAVQCLYRLIEGREWQEFVAGVVGSFGGRDKEAVFQSISSISQHLQTHYNPQPLDSQSLEPLCTQGQFCLNYSIFGDKINRKCANIEVALAHHRGSLFILYPNFTLDSFVDLNCPHFALKYDLYRKMQGVCREWAVNKETMGGIEVLSDCCRQDVREIVINCCFSSEITPPNAKNPKDCKLCGRLILEKKPKWCLKCRICANCVAKNYFTANFALTPCCRLHISPELQLEIRQMLIDTHAHMRGTMERLKNDKEMSWSERYRTGMEGQRPATAALPGSYQALDMQNPWVRLENEGYQQPGKNTKAGNKANMAMPKQTKSLLVRGQQLPQQGEVPDNRGEEWMQIDAEEVKAVPGTTSDRPVDLTQGEELPPRPEVQVRDLGEGRNTNCRVCGEAYTIKDKEYQCPGACRCRHCIIEVRARKVVIFCKNCNENFPKGTRKLIDDSFDRCHICGIAVKCTEMERLAPCNNVCRRCVLLNLKPNTRVSKSTKAFCPCNPEITFTIDPQRYKDLAEMPISACCTRATLEDQDLSCSHRVCKTHETNLKVCRSCQRPRYT